MFWSEHSERSVLATAGAAMGMGDHLLDPLGRWKVKAKGSKRYVRSTGAIVVGVQKRIATAMRSSDGEFYEDSETRRELKKFLKARGASDELAARVESNHTDFLCSLRATTDGARDT